MGGEVDKNLYTVPGESFCPSTPLPLGKTSCQNQPRFHLNTIVGPCWTMFLIRFKNIFPTIWLINHYTKLKCSVPTRMMFLLWRNDLSNLPRMNTTYFVILFCTWGRCSEIFPIFPRVICHDQCGENFSLFRKYGCHSDRKFQLWFLQANQKYGAKNCLDRWHGRYSDRLIYQEHECLCNMTIPG